MTLVPANIRREEREAKAASKLRWKSHNGWVYPGVPTSEVSNKHPHKPDPASIDRLCEEWDEEKTFVSFKLKSPLNRSFYRHGPNRHKDFDIWSKPTGEKLDPVTIFDAGDTRAQLEKQVQK
jgi:hypothetical protein